MRCDIYFSAQPRSFCSFSFSLLPSPIYLLFAHPPYKRSPPLAHSSCTTAQRTGFPKNQTPRQRLILLSYGFRIAFFAFTKQKQSGSISKSTPQDKWKMEWKYPAETRYHHARLSVQGRKSEMKMRDICCIVGCTTWACWDDDMKMSSTGAEQRRTEQLCKQLRARKHGNPPMLKTSFQKT